MNKEEYTQAIQDLRNYFYAGGMEADFVNKMIALRGENEILWIHDGYKERPLIDVNSGCFGPISIGYSNPYFIDKLYEQSKKLVHTLFASDIAIEFSKEMASITPEGFSRVFLSTSASHANEAAMRLSWEANKKWSMIAVKEAYHGMELNVAGLTSLAGFRKTIYPVSPKTTILMTNCYCYRCPFGLDYPSCNYQCAYALEDAIQASPSPPSALIIEPIQQAYFFPPPSNKYFQILGKICKKHDMYLIVDEAQFGGVGRLGGEWFATQLFDIPTDILTTGKGIGNGVPIGVTIAKDEILNRAGTGISGKSKNSKVVFWTTHLYDPLLAAAGVAVIKYIKEKNLVNRTKKMGDYIINQLRQIQKESKIMGRVDGRGLYIGIELVKDKETKNPFPEAVDKFWRFALKKGVLFPARKRTNIIGIRPPLTIERKNVDKIINVVADGVKEIEKTMIK